MSVSIIKKVLEIIIYVFCITFFCTQAWTACKQFIRYETGTKVSFKNLEDVETPQIALCFENGYKVNLVPERIFGDRPGQFHFQKLDCCNKYCLIFSEQNCGIAELTEFYIFNKFCIIFL